MRPRSNATSATRRKAIPALRSKYRFHRAACGTTALEPIRYGYFFLRTQRVERVRVVPCFPRPVPVPRDTASSFSAKEPGDSHIHKLTCDDCCIVLYSRRGRRHLKMDFFFLSPLCTETRGPSGASRSSLSLCLDFLLLSFFTPLSTLSNFFPRRNGLAHADVDVTYVFYLSFLSFFSETHAHCCRRPDQRPRSFFFRPPAAVFFFWESLLFFFFSFLSLFLLGTRG